MSRSISLNPSSPFSAKISLIEAFCLSSMIWSRSINLRPVASASNMDHMNSQGTTLWLQTSEERLFSRLIVKRHTRPLLADRTDNEIRNLIKKQLEARSPFYSRASIIWHGDLLENRREIDDNISAFLKAFPILPANQARSRPLFSSQIRKMLLTKLQKTPTSQTN